MADGCRSVRLVAWDLDGTLLRGDTVCEGIARRIGRLDRMRAFERLTSQEEIRTAREEMAAWYAPLGDGALLAHLCDLRLAPGAEEAFVYLRDRGVRTAIVSITWEFAVASFARALGADFHVGTRLGPDGIGHFWAEDKATWLADLAARLGIGLAEIGAVGDSSGDVPMLRAVGHPVFVGRIMPPDLAGVPHHPDADLLTIARMLAER